MNSCTLLGYVAFVHTVTERDRESHRGGMPTHHSLNSAILDCLDSHEIPDPPKVLNISCQ